MKTFIDLYEFLQKYNDKDIISWLNNEKTEKPWKGKDKQESLLRLFANLKLINKLSNYNTCKGNYNLKTITKLTSLKDIFYDNKNNPINLKDKGDSSDLTCIANNNSRHLLLTTCKNINKLQVGKLDIDKILTNFKQYKKNGYTMSLCICIRDKKEFDIMKDNIESTNNKLKDILNKQDTIIIDWNDLNQAFHQFKSIFNNRSLNTIIKSDTNIQCLKMHQQLGVLKTIRMKSNGKKRILWGHIQRSGKSYIISGCIIKDSCGKETCNYLVITTAPKETINQQTKVFNCLQLQDFNIIILNGKNKKPILTDKNIILCSKQFLQNKLKVKSIKWLKEMVFDMRFVDESHNGGTTSLAKKTLDYYGKNSFTVQITATYFKPVNDYNIPRENWILWDLEDIKLCQNINNKESINKLVIKHGTEIKDIISKYSLDNIITEYSKYPNLWLLTDKINNKNREEIINATRENDYGWSTTSCFLLKQGVKKINKDTEIVIKEEFQKEEETLKLWYRIFGKYGKYNVPDKDYPDNKVFLKRIEKICQNPAINSRFIGCNKEPMIIMAFLPQTNINEISNATIKLLKKYKVIPDYEIISINSKTTNDPKQSIEDARIKARNSDKKGVLVLSGKQCSLGVSINNCDIVLLLNNNTSFDMIYQMMFRCMTEGKNKKCGFVVDLNIQRVIENSLINYASLIKPNKHPQKAIKYILQERLITLNGDHWMPCFGNKTSSISTLCKNIYEIYSSNTESALNHFLNRLRFKEVLLSQEEQKIFNVMFSNKEPTTQQKELIDKLINNDNNSSDKEEEIKKGIEKIKVENDTNNNDDKKEEKKEIKYMDILKHIIPLVCLLTIHNKETSFVEMFNVIKNDKYIYDILINQTKSWWGKNVDSRIIKKFISVYLKYMKDEKETKQIIRTVKELFMKNIKNNKELSKLIDKYLIPQELEKKSNAEVSTPYKLRQEMLDKMPNKFFTKKQKVFEPCAGKGGFIVDIIDRFMIGLKKVIKNEKKRYKTIVEECLYFSDINPTNIFICKLLIDPYNEYKLNYNEGNTLELDIGEKWDIKGFDAVIGNPPYSTNPSKQNTKPLYNKFIEKYIDMCKYLLFVVPSRWFIGGKGLVKFRTFMMKRKDIVFIHHKDDATEWFGNSVNIKGGVNYFLKDTLYNELCSFNGIPYDLSKYDCIIKPRYHKIIDIVSNMDSINKLYMCRYFGIETNDKRIKDNGKIKCYVSSLKSKNRYKYIDTYDFTETNSFWKVITPEASFKAFSGFGEKFIGNPNEVHTGSYISFRTSSEEKAKSLLSYLDTKFANHMLSVRKISQHINSDVCKWIPLVPLDKECTDTMVYKFFNITENDIELIEKERALYV